MNEIEIDEIITNYRNNNLSKSEFLRIQNENQGIDWNKLVRQENFIDLMFQANVYENLRTKLDADIDKIEKKNKLTKLAVVSSIIMCVAGLGYYFNTSKEKAPQENSSHVKEIEQTSSKESIAPNHVIFEKEIVVPEKTQTTNPRDFSTKNEIPKVDTVNETTPLVKFEEEKNTDTEPIITDIIEEVKPVRFEKEATAKTEAVVSIKTTTSTPTISEKETEKEEEVKSTVKTPTKTSPTSENYIINTSFGEVITFDNPLVNTTLTIQTIAGEVIYKERFEKEEEIQWNGTNQNQTILSTGLYIYQLSTEEKIIKFGQISLVQ